MDSLDLKQAEEAIKISKPHIFYLAAQNQVFALFNSDNYLAAVALLEAIYYLSERFEKKIPDLKLKMFIDSGRIAGLRICTKIKELIVNLSRNQEIEQFASH